MPHVAAINQITAAYGIPGATIAQPQRGYRNHSYGLTLRGGRQLNLIQYKREPAIVDRIKRANLAGERSAQAGLPSRHPTNPRILRIGGRTSVTYAALYNYLPGDTIPWEAYTRRHLKLLGLSLARLHRALAPLVEPNVIQSHSAALELTHQLEQMISYFNHPQVKQAIGSKLHLSINQDWLNAQRQIIQFADDLPLQQPLHLDFVRSNLLFAAAQPQDSLQLDGIALTGILDFEKTAWGHPLLDLARTLAFLLVDCRHKTQPQIRKYFLYSGYTKRGLGHIDPIHRPGSHKPFLEELTDYYLIYDFYKFLRHNPYESLKHNLHFRQTVGLLLQRNIIRHHAVTIGLHEPWNATPISA